MSAAGDWTGPCLVVTSPASMAGLVLRLMAPEVVIGHSDTADVILDDRYVSRKHALITVDASEVVTVCDLNSTGGTFVNGERIESPRVLRAGDVVRFADVEARFEPVGADPNRAAPPTEIATAPQSATPTPSALPPAQAGPGGGAAQASTPETAQHSVVREVQTQLSQLGYSIPAEERTAAEAGAGTGAALAQFQAASALPQTGEADATTTAALTAVVAGHSYVVTGSVRSPSLPGVPGVAVQLVDKNVGGDEVLASTTSAVGGSFRLSAVLSPAYLAKHSKSLPDLQVQVLTGAVVLASSEVRYSAPRTVSMDVVVPVAAAGLPSEFETLTASLATAYPGSLGALQEDSTRQDITYLANKTGWDARAVALAALADQFSEIKAPAPAATAAPTTAAAAVNVATEPTAAATTDDADTVTNEAVTDDAAAATETGTPNDTSNRVRPEFYYALFRAGLPANADGLFQVSPSVVQTVWRQAIDQGLIPQELSKEIPAATKTFQALSAAKVLTAAPTVGVSTLADMLKTTLPEAAQQEEFAQLYTQYRGDTDALWPAVEQALGAGPTAQLQSLGKLYYLTLNNQPLVEALVKTTSGNGATALGSPLELATRGYYEASAWTPLIAADSIPPQIPGADAAEQSSNYAELLAAQVRLSYPTAVLADQVKRGVLPVSDTDDIASAVADFLNAHQGAFEIGVEPVEAFIARTGVTGTTGAVIAQVKRFQRVYQLTPDDSSLATLLNHNLDSAYAITRYDPAGFVRSFSAHLGDEDIATAIHARARQVYVSVMSIATEYLKSRVAPTLGGASPVQYGFPPPSSTPPPSVVAYPTLEGLFGSLDYCACSDCGSILSPAAYFVDLLHFVDQPAPSAGFENPQDVLFGRRPDLEYLNLSCANTNTAMPYIDIVNETLEYYIANGLSIEGYEGHNTSEDITSAELIASPQFVNDDAYTVMQGAFFPPPLPFNRLLTLLRLQLNSMGIELPAAMEALRANDNLTNTSTPTSYGWQDILLERLGISREQYRIFTDTTLDLGDLYGLPPGLTAAHQLEELQGTSLQDFSRRLGVSYDDFVSILETRFINPNAALIPLLEQLQCTFTELEALDSDPASQSAAFINALPAGLAATQYGATTPDDYDAVVTWVTTNYSRIGEIITMTNTAGNADDCSGADLFFRYTNPASPLLSGTDFLKLILFVQLWQMLAPLLAESSDAAAIADADSILSALYPAQNQPLLTNTYAQNQVLIGAGFATMLLGFGFVVQVMTQLSLSADTSLDQLLACWADIGTLGSSSLYATMFLTPALLQQDPGAQTAIVSSTVGPGDVLTTTINAINGVAAEVAYTVAAGQDAATVATEIAVLINSCAAIDPATAAVGLPVPVSDRYLAAAGGGVITLRAGFTLACAISAGATESYAPPAALAGTLIATVAGTPMAGDMLTTTIDGVEVPYTVLAAATPDWIAAGIAAAINDAPAASVDPLAQEAINVAFSASSSGATVIVKRTTGAGFTLGCSVSSATGSPPTESYTTESPVYRTATVGGTLTPGDILTTMIDTTVEIPYSVLTTDTPNSVAAGIATAINSTTLADPYSGLPVNDLVVATSSGPTVAILAANAGAAFTLACSLAPPASGSTDASSYSVAAPTPACWTVTITGGVSAGDELVTTINGVDIPYTAGAADTDATALAQSIAATISAATELDPATGLPLRAIVAATGSAGTAAGTAVVTITAVDPSTPFTVASQVVAPAAETYVTAGPLPQSAVATVSGSVPQGVTLTTTINGVPVLYTVGLGDTPATIAQEIAQSITATTTADPISSTQLNKLVSVSYGSDAEGQGLVTVTATKVTTPFTIEVAMTAGGYAAGHQTPPFADSGSGQLLTDPTQTLLGHEPTLCAACNITGGDFQLIVDALGYDASTPLTLTTVSELFRYGWLAHTLGLSVAEFLLLRSSTGLGPFAPLYQDSLTVVEPPVIRFLDLLNAMSNGGLDTDQALYLMWNQDISGASAPSSDEITGLAIALRAAFATVDAAFTLQDDPSGSIAQGLMTLVYGATATDFFFGLLNSTFTVSVSYSSPPGVANLAAAVIEASAGRLSYDDIAKLLTFAGVLDAATQAAIDAAITVDTTSASTTNPGLATFIPASMVNIGAGSALLIDTAAAQETVIVATTTATTFTTQTINAHNGSVTPFSITNDPTLVESIASLGVANAQAVSPFFAAYSELKPVYLAYVASTDPPQIKRTTMLANFLPILSGERKQEQALASVTSTAGTDQGFAAALLGDASILHADADPSAPAVTDFTAIGHQGLAAQFFLTDDLAAKPDEQAACVPVLSYSPTATIGGTITPGEILTTTLAGVAVGYTVGAFTLACASTAGASITLTPASQVAAVSQIATVGGTVTPGDTVTATLDGVPVPYTVVAGDTATTIAASIAAAINATTVEDPAVGSPLNEVLVATSAGDAVTVTVAPGGPSTLPAQIARGIAAAINATTTAVAGVPLNQVVSASATDSTVALARANVGGGTFFSIACAVSGGASTTYTAGTELPAAAGGGQLAAIWSGYITAPQGGAYDVNIAADPGATLTLEIDGEKVLSGVVPGSGLLTNDTEIALLAGELVPIVLTAGSISTTLSVSWRSQGIGWQAIPSQYLYSSTLVTALSDTYARFLKTASLAGALSLTAQEIAVLGTGPSFSVDTTSASETTPGPASFTPASMANIQVGTQLVIDGPAMIPNAAAGIDSPGAQEAVTVTATTSTTFSVLTTQPHGGTSSPFPIVSAARPTIGQGWINSLAGAPTDLETTAANDMTAVLEALLDFARIKQALSPNDSRLLAVLVDPATTLPNGQSALLTLTGWSQESLAALLTQFFPHSGIASLASVENLARVYDAFAVVTTSRLSASTLISAITNAPSATTVSTLQSALRAQYAPADWLTAVTPINNALRIAQRDALVAYILQLEGDRYQQALVRQSTVADAVAGATELGCADGAGIAIGMSVQGANVATGTVVTGIGVVDPLTHSRDVTISSRILGALPAGSDLVFVPVDAVDLDTPDDLYACLMIDPENQPPVLTSRILLASLTVQLFVERVIRNLELQAAPSDINVSQWTWMKRYRVWQANREVFLWPENWLYPELRDNQSPFFQTTMSALLQGDIDEDAATNAYLDYLTNLEQVAKLEACGIYYELATSDTNETAIVVSRTAGAHRKYYFRELSSGSWDPWAEAQIDCEDLPLTPIVWNGRLFLFWLKVVKQSVLGKLDSSTVGESSDTAVAQYNIADFDHLAGQTQSTQSLVTIGAVLCWSEYYNGKWQPTKTSDINLPTSISSQPGGGGLGDFPASGSKSFEQTTRGLLRLVPAYFTGQANNPRERVLTSQFTLPGDTLILGIALDNMSVVHGSLFAYGGFVLHNTHSLPVRLEDMWVPPSRFLAGHVEPTPLWQLLALPSPSRTLSAVQTNPPNPPLPTFSGASGTGGFSILYENTLGFGAVFNNPVLDFTWIPRFVEPQPGLAWDAPFIYEDRRSIFYVNTTKSTATFLDSVSFGISSTELGPVARGRIPGLVLRSDVVAPGAPVASGPAQGNPSATQRYLVDETDLNAALSSSTAVTYQGRVVSPTGSVPLPTPVADDDGKGA
jgi:hypothetical protein